MTPTDIRDTAIPEDVMEAAFHFACQISYAMPDPSRDQALFIEAIMAATEAERERCLGIEKLWGEVARDLGQRVEATIASDIERHIRTGSPSEEKPHD